MIKVRNLDAAFAAIDKWLLDTEMLVEDVAKGLIYKGLDIAASTSPQYSGDFAANWKISRNKIDTSFQSGLFPDKTFPVPEGVTPFQRGDTQPILHAIKESAGKLSGARLGETLWLANSAKHDDLLQETYAWKIEGNLVRLRPVNYGGDGPLRQVKEILKASYTRINRNNVRELL